MILSEAHLMIRDIARNLTREQLAPHAAHRIVGATGRSPAVVSGVRQVAAVASATWRSPRRNER